MALHTAKNHLDLSLVNMSDWHQTVLILHRDKARWMGDDTLVRRAVTVPYDLSLAIGAGDLDRARHLFLVLYAEEMERWMRMLPTACGIR